MKTSVEQNHFSLTLCISLIISMGWITLLAILIPPDSNIVSKDVIELFLYPDALRPEPNERFIYYCSIVSILPISYAAVYLARRYQQKFDGFDYFFKLAPVFLIFYLISINWISLTFWIRQEIVNPSRLLTFSFITAIIIIIYQKKFIRLSYSSKFLASILFLSLIIANLSTLKVLALVNDNRFEWAGLNFEIVLYPISQVMAGKTLLADLPSQYGLYPEFLRPIFLVIPLSVGSFTFVMTGLNVIAQLSIIYLFVFNLLKNKILKILFIFSILAVISFNSWRDQGINNDFYFAYFPIRFLFPAIYLFLTNLYIRGANSVYSDLGMGLFIGCAIAWNLDSGVPVMGSFIGLLLFRGNFLFSRSKFRQTLSSLIVVMLSIVFTIIAINLLLEMRSGKDIAYLSWINTISISYLSGYFMLPIERSFFAPWLVIYLVYIAGITISIYSKVNKLSGINYDFIFVLSILGIGLFSYFQGRSHNLNLMCVLWPSLLLVFIFIDLLFEKQLYFSKIGKYNNLILIPLITWPIFLSISFMVYLLPTTVYSLAGSLQFLKNYQTTSIIENIKFINKINFQKNNILIMSNHQALFYAESGILNPIGGPGIIETYLKVDEQRINQEIDSGNKIKEIILDEEYLLKYKNTLSARYIFVDKSDFGIYYYRLKDF